MNNTYEVLIDIRKEDIKIREMFSNQDMVSITDLLNKIDELDYYYHEALDEVAKLKEGYEPDEYDEWKDRQLENDR